MRLGLWQSRDEKKRLLHIEVAKLRQAHAWQKGQAERFKKENAELKKELKFKKETIARLEQEIQEIGKQRDRYRDMVFKKNVDPDGPSEEGLADQPASSLPVKGKKQRGAQPGHLGRGRKRPQRVNEVKRVYLDRCPDCGTELSRSSESCSHTVEDLPVFEEPQTRVTRYEVERQWCGTCKKKVKAQPAGVIPRCRLGLNLLLYVIIQKYGAKISWETIVFNLQILYGVTVSKGALVAMVHRVRQILGDRYAALLEEIRGSPVKHADETAWRVNGINHWLWGFFTPTAAYYTIEESRGKGIPSAILAGSHEDDVLVRDDYAAYTKLPLKQQSCWAHLLRKCREYAEDPRHASPEVKALYASLKTMFVDLQNALSGPYARLMRQCAYKSFKQRIDSIINTCYHHRDAREIRGRITHQNAKLITAILHKNVPLTNNLAERQLRPMVVTRKISGGSRSWEGAKTHAVNMSVFQTIRLQNQPLIPTLKKLILPSFTQN